MGGDGKLSPVFYRRDSLRLGRSGVGALGVDSGVGRRLGRRASTRASGVDPGIVVVVVCQVELFLENGGFRLALL